MLRWARTTHVAQERVKDLRIAHAHDRRLVRIEPKKAHEPNRFGRGGVARPAEALDLREGPPHQGGPLSRGGDPKKRGPGGGPGPPPRGGGPPGKKRKGPPRKEAP